MLGRGLQVFVGELLPLLLGRQREGPVRVRTRVLVREPGPFRGAGALSLLLGPPDTPSKTEPHKQTLLSPSVFSM